MRRSQSPKKDAPSQTTTNNKQQQRKRNIKNFPMLYGTAWKKERSADLVAQAIELGFRGVDTACQPKHYNEKGVGQGIQRALQSNPSLKREHLFIQTKFSSVDAQNPADLAKGIPYYASDDLETQVNKSLNVSLENLAVDYLDSWVLHGPLRTYQDTLRVWRAMEQKVDEGRVDRLGISNCYDLNYLKRLAADAKHPPEIIQNRFYGDTNWDIDIRTWARESDPPITYQSFWTLTANPALLKAIRPLSQHKQIPPESLLYMYLIQRGCQPLNGSCTAAHIKEDLAFAGNIGDDNKLTSQELKAIGGLIGDEF